MPKAPVTYYVTRGACGRAPFAVVMQAGNTIETGTEEFVRKLYPHATKVEWSEQARAYVPAA